MEKIMFYHWSEGELLCIRGEFAPFMVEFSIDEVEGGIFENFSGAARGTLMLKDFPAYPDRNSLTTITISWEALSVLHHTSSQPQLRIRSRTYEEDGNLDPTLVRQHFTEYPQFDEPIRLGILLRITEFIKQQRLEERTLNLHTQ